MLFKGDGSVLSPLLGEPAKELSAKASVDLDGETMEQGVLLDPNPLVDVIDKSTQGSDLYPEVPPGLDPQSNLVQGTLSIYVVACVDFVGYNTCCLKDDGSVPSPVLGEPAKELSANFSVDLDGETLEQGVLLDPNPLVDVIDKSAQGFDLYPEVPLGLDPQIMERVLPQGNFFIHLD